MLYVYLPVYYYRNFSEFPMQQDNNLFFLKNLFNIIQLVSKSNILYFRIICFVTCICKISPSYLPSVMNYIFQNFYIEAKKKLFFYN